MSLYVLPEHIKRAIEKEVDRYLEENPDLVEHRDQCYNALLKLYYEDGSVGKLFRPNTLPREQECHDA